MNAISTFGTTSHVLWFGSLFTPGSGFAFPCDAQGHVDLDALGPRALDNYLYARTVVGFEFACPAIELWALPAAPAPGEALSLREQAAYKAALKAFTADSKVDASAK